MTLDATPPPHLREEWERRLWREAVGIIAAAAKCSTCGVEGEKVGACLSCSGAEEDRT